MSKSYRYPIIKDSADRSTKRCASKAVRNHNKIRINSATEEDFDELFSAPQHYKHCFQSHKISDSAVYPDNLESINKYSRK